MVKEESEMSIPKRKQSALGLSNLDATVLVTKTLITTAIALATWVGVAAPASADPNSANAGANSFGALSCSCQETASAGSPTLKEEIDQGIRQGGSAELRRP
jgi:hypothetical protein